MTNCHQHRPRYLFCPNPTCAWPLEPMTCLSCCYLLLHPWKCLWLFLWSMSVQGWHANTFPGHGFSGTSWCISPQLLSAERCTFHRTVSWISCRCHVSGIRERGEKKWLNSALVGQYRLKYTQPGSEFTITSYGDHVTLSRSIVSFTQDVHLLLQRWNKLNCFVVGEGYSNCYALLLRSQ